MCKCGLGTACSFVLNKMKRRWWGAVSAGALVYTNDCHKSCRVMASLCGLSLGSSTRKPGPRGASAVGGVACVPSPTPAAHGSPASLTALSLPAARSEKVLGKCKSFCDSRGHHALEERSHFLARRPVGFCAVKEGCVSGQQRPGPHKLHPSGERAGLCSGDRGMNPHLQG